MKVDKLKCGWIVIKLPGITKVFYTEDAYQLWLKGYTKKSLDLLTNLS